MRFLRRAATVEVPLPDLARRRAEEIVRLSRDHSEASAFRSSREVIGPALLYGLAHMHERYSAAAARRGPAT
jgi:transcriptional regulator with AAA-type ATPase domain